MPCLGQLSLARRFSAQFAGAWMFVAMISLHGSAFAQVTPPGGNSGQVGQVGQDADETTRQLFQSIEWQGPGIVPLGTIGELKVSRGLMFAEPKGARTFLELSHRPAPHGLLGILAPHESLDWFIVFESRPELRGSDGKGRIDADALLRTLRREAEEQNTLRRARGWQETKGLEWETLPAYEGSRHELTWATKFDAGGKPGINCTTRIFGRVGAIDAHLVVNPKDAARVRPTLRNVLGLVEFKEPLRENGSDQAGGDDSSSSSLGKLSVRSIRWIGGALIAVLVTIGGVIKKLRFS